MEENESRSTGGSSPGASNTATSEQVMDQLRGLRRSSSDKVIAGVCGGVGRSLGVDPLLLRVVAAVLVLFGGAGIVLYAIAWLVLPVDDGTPSVGSQAVDRGQHHPGSQTVWLAVVLAVAVVLGVIGAFGRWDGPILLSLAVVGLLVWLLRRDTIQPPQAAAQAPTAQSPAQSSAPTATQTLQQPLHGWAPAQLSPPAPETALPQPQPRPQPRPKPERKPRSRLLAVTLSVMLIALGTLGAFDVSGFDPPNGAYPALALAVLALGLVAGTWFGRARSLIVWGMLLSLVTLVVSVAGQGSDLARRAVDQRVVVTSVDALPTATKFGAGQIEYDLSGLQLDGRSGSMNANMGFGEIDVVVPPDVDVTVGARAGVGATTLFGDSDGGINRHRTLTDYGADGPGGGTLDLTLYVGFGHVEVRRASS